MARETREERAVRLEKERVEAVERATAEYPARLMSLLERATKTGEFELTVKNAAFVVTQLNENYGEMSLSLNYSFDSFDNLNDLEWRVDLVERERAEEERKARVRREARAKLTKEELELLGL